MKKCKYCQTELEDDALLCTNCGHSVEEESSAAPEAEAPAAEQADTAAAQNPEEAAADTTAQTPDVAAVTPESTGKAAPWKVALAVAAVVVLMAVLIALIVTSLSGDSAKKQPEANYPSNMTEESAPQYLDTAPEEVPATVPEDGNPDDVTCKGTYTVSDDDILANRDVVVATIGDRQLTNAQLQVYYWMEVQGFLNKYGMYAAYFGLDYTKPLDTQLSDEEGNLTWQQYFLQSALENWQQTQAMALEAENANMEISQEDQETMDGLRAAMEENAAYYSMTLEELMRNNLGVGAGYEEFAQYHENYYHGKPYYTAETEKMVPTDQDLEEFFDRHAEEYAANGVTKDAEVVDVRHILLMPEGGTKDDSGNTIYSDDEWAACEKAAQEVLDTWLAGEKTEESFGELANEKSADGGSNTNGGLYTDVTEGYMTEAYNDWCFDESRMPGDYGLVRTPFGYHVMYFVERRPQWLSYAKSDWVGEKTNELLDELIQRHPMEVDYSKIMLGYVSLG